MDFGCVSDSGGGSGADTRLSSWPDLCPLSTGRTDVQKPGISASHLLLPPPLFLFLKNAILIGGNELKLRLNG